MKDNNMQSKAKPQSNANQISNARTKRGFTFVEILIAVAIIAMLSLIAIPGVQGIQQVLKSTEMQAGARQIYIAVQNRLTVMKSAGTLKTLDPVWTPSLLTESRVLWIEQDHMPLDYDNSENSWSGQELCYVVGKNSDGSATEGKVIADMLLSQGSVESLLLQNYCVIEYNPSNGTVYGIFYSDEYFLYSEVRDTDRTKATLRSIDGQPTIGYYGGIGNNIPDAQDADPADSAFIIENQEALVLRIEPVATKNYTLTIESKVDPTDFNSYTYAFTGNQTEFTGYSNLSIDLATDDIIVTLDSLETGLHFSDLFLESIDKPAIVPGSDLRISLLVEDVNGDRLLIPSTTSKVVNSLFQSLAQGSAMISCNRHLQNLEPTISGVSGVVGATLLSSLDWGNSASTFFVPISNPQLISFQGSGNTIRDLAITANGERCGLFGEFGGSATSPGSISGVGLIDASVSGGNADYVGSMAGYLHHTTLTDCSVYVINSAGRLTANAADAVGGFVGTSNNNTYTYCFSSLKDLIASVKGSSASSGVGGFAGISSQDTLTNCYANTTQMTVTTLGTYAYSGGFAGRANSTIQYSYALGNIKQTGGTAAGGFWYDFGGSASQCYSATTFEQTTGLSGSSYGFSNRASTSCSYFSGATPTYTTLISGITARDLSGLSSAYNSVNWRTPTVTNTKPYSVEFLGQSYPIALVPRLIHYGNWPVASNNLIEIGDTGIWRPNVEIPSGKVMIFKDGEYIYLTLADLLKPAVVGNDILQGGSLYVPQSAGAFEVGSNKTINWNIAGDIIIESNILIDNATIKIIMLSQNGDVIINDIDITAKSSQNPYIVTITADNGAIKANKVIINTKSASGGIIRFLAQNDIEIREAQIISAGDKGINIQSLEGDIYAEGAVIRATNSNGNAVITLQSAGVINLDQATVASKVNLTISGGEAVYARSSNITNTGSGKNIAITSSNSGIDLSSLASPIPATLVASSGGRVDITAKENISIPSATIQAKTGTSGSVLQFLATGEGGTLWVGGATVKGKSIKAQNLTLVGTLKSGVITVSP